MALVANTEQRTPARILLADDQGDILDALQLLLKPGGYQTKVVTQPSTAGALPAGEGLDLLLIDLNYTRDTTSGGEGLDLLSQIRVMDETLPVLVMTAWSTVDLAVEAMRRGACDFVQKPWQNSHLLEKIQAQVARHRDLVSQQPWREQELREAREIQKNLFPKAIPSRAWIRNCSHIAAVSCRRRRLLRRGSAQRDTDVALDCRRLREGFACRTAYVERTGSA